MRTIANIVDEIHGMRTVAMFISPAYDATLTEAIQHPDTEQIRVHHLLLVFRRSSAPPSNPCLVVTSEVPEAGGEPVLGIYDESGNGLPQQDSGNWTDSAQFGRRAIEAASQRLGTTFTEYRTKAK